MVLSGFIISKTFTITAQGHSDSGFMSNNVNTILYNNALNNALIAHPSIG